MRMRITILAKLIFLLLLLTILPLSILGYVAINDAKNLGLEAANDAKVMGDRVVEDSVQSLNNLGEIIIENQAILTKKLLDQYIENNPDVTLDDLVASEEFQSLGIQPVGEKGYTVVVQVDNQRMLAHPNEALLGKVMLDSLRGNPKMDDWWRVVETTYNNPLKDSFGYYKWPEADDTYSEKYQYLTVLDNKVEDKYISVSATTYVSEFTEPVEQTKIKIKDSLDNTLASIQSATNGLSTQNTILFITLISVFVVIIVSIIFARSLTKQLKELTKVGNKLSEGDLSVKVPEIKTNDEIKDLSESFKSALAAISFLIGESKNKNK